MEEFADGVASAPVWAEWHYEALPWQQFGAQEWQRARQAATRSFRWALGAIPLLLGLCSVPAVLQSRPGSGLLLVSLWLGGAGLLLGLDVVLYQVDIQVAAQRRAQWDAGPPRIRITPIGITAGAGYWPLQRWGSGLVEPRLTLQAVYVVAAEPDVLCFRVSQRHGLQPSSEVVRLPIPPAAAGTVPALITRFEREVIYGGPWRDPPADPAPRPAARPRAHPTTRLGRPWVGGTPQSQRYGPGAPEGTPAEHPTHKLPPPGGPG